ncbi:MAG: hypothetical protein M3546_00625 [Actinomycetota bacterium]|nr:hypothetical protein [Actinomycetota bacterium]
MSVASSSVAAARGASRTLDGLLEHPRAVLGTLVATQVVATIFLAASVPHNGWVWFHNGDQIWITTQGWMLGHLELPPTELGYLWSLVLAPIMLVTGPTYVQALPPIMALNLFVLAPIALLCVYGIAAQIGGRLLGYWASFLWVVAPFASIPLFVDRYQERWTEHFLPQALGLTSLSDFPSLVVVLAAALFVVRSLDASRVADAALAGLLLGAAGGMKPPNLLLGAGAALAYLVARRWREGLVFGTAIVPSLLVLVLWKERGLGQLPVLSLGEARLAAGAGLAALDVDRYIELDLEHWRVQMDNLREFFWSARLAQWAPFAGLLAVLRVRRAPIAALLGGWLAAFIVVKGFSTRADIQANTFWRLLMPAWPAYLILFASIPLLVPTFARRLGDRLRPALVRPLSWRWVAVAAALTVALPTVAIAAASPSTGPKRAVFQDDAGNFIMTSIAENVKLEVQRTGDGNLLSWTSGGPWRGDVFYRIYRLETQDVECEHTDGATSVYCFIRSIPIATTRETEHLDRDAPPGAWYRVGVGTNWLDDETQGDVFAFSRAFVAP